MEKNAGTSADKSGRDTRESGHENVREKTGAPVKSSTRKRRGSARKNSRAPKQRVSQKVRNRVKRFSIHYDRGFFQKEIRSLPVIACVIVVILCFAGLAVGTVRSRGSSEIQDSAKAVAAADNSFYGISEEASLLLEGAGAMAADAQAEVENAIRAEYRQILDRGQGNTVNPSGKLQKRLWKEERKARKEELAEDPFLILVNKWHYEPDGYEVNPVTLSNGQSIADSCYEPLVEMLEDCTAAGGTPIVCSGYRAHWYQVNLFDAQIDRWLYAGYGQEDAERLAATAVAIPGTSEHELGLAADIYSSENMDLDESQVNTFTQQWLMQNSWRYGFILRYPKDKQEITGIIFEPWHYRYVGKEHAENIYRAGICLEEYLDEVE